MPATHTLPAVRTVPAIYSIKNTLADSIRARLSEEGISVTRFAMQIGTGRTAVRRILDGDNTSITLHTMAKAAHALGLRLVLETEKLTPQELGALANDLATTENAAKASRLKREILAGFYADPKSNAKSSAKKRTSLADVALARSHSRTGNRTKRVG